MESLLEHLDIFDLQTLRLVCKTTKSWVETPKTLRRFPVRITGKDRLDEVLRAPDPVPWNNFIFFQGNHHASIFSDADITQRFLAAYGELVRELKFKWKETNYYDMCKSEQAWLHLLPGCPHLESLRMKLLNFEHVTNELADQLLENWKNMRHFHVKKFNRTPNTEPDPMLFFPRMLVSCTHLQTLTFPSFMDMRNQSATIEDKDPHNFERLVVNTVLNVIEEKRIRSVLASDFIIGDGKLLQRIALACRKSGTVLRGVRVNGSLKNLLSNDEQLSVLDIIDKLDLITDRLVKQPLTNVGTIVVNPTTFKLTNCAYIPRFPHLESINMAFIFYCNPQEVNDPQRNKALELFVDRLVQVKRPTVKRLLLQLGASSKNLPLKFSPVNLCTSFVNLRSLRLRLWEGRDAEWLQLWPLVGQTLVKLELRWCPNLSDRGILGDDLNQPAFLQLKHLRQLLLIMGYSKPEKWKITEESFMHVFRHMRLRLFHFLELSEDTAPRRFKAETMTAMWNGAFGETIEEFMFQGVDLPRPNEQ